MSEDSQSWLDSLAGRVEPEDGDKQTPKLRDALQRREAALRGDRSGLQTLMKRLEAEGLVQPEGGSRTRNWIPYAAAASVVGVAILAGLLVTTPDGPIAPSAPEETVETVRYRGFGTEVAVAVGDPLAWVSSTQQALDSANCAHRRAEGEGLVLTVDAAPHCLAPLNEALQGTGIVIDEPGRYRLVVNPSR